MLAEPHGNDRGEFRETFGTKFALFIAEIVALIGMAVALYWRSCDPDFNITLI